MANYTITTSTGYSTHTQSRAAATRDYVKLVRLSYATNGALAGESVTLRRDGALVAEHIGSAHLAHAVAARLVALDAAPAQGLAAPDDDSLNI
jgi:hypothetical protein